MLKRFSKECGYYEAQNEQAGSDFRKYYNRRMPDVAVPPIPVQRFRLEQLLLNIPAVLMVIVKLICNNKKSFTVKNRRCYECIVNSSNVK